MYPPWSSMPSHENHFEQQKNERRVSHLCKYGGSANPGHEDPEQQAPEREASVSSPTSTNHSNVILTVLQSSLDRKE